MSKLQEMKDYTNKNYEYVYLYSEPICVDSPIEKSMLSSPLPTWTLALGLWNCGTTQL